MNRLTRGLALLLAGALALGAQAAPIVFTYTGVGSGSLGGNAFAASAFTITGRADTTNLASCGATCGYIDHSSVSIDIAGLGVYDFSTGTRTFRAGTFVGLSRAGLNGADLYNMDVAGAALWDMISDFGPLNANSAGLLQWGFSPVLTNGGQLLFDSASIGRTASFSAALDANRVPEPGALALLSLALLAGGLALRRR